MPKRSKPDKAIQLTERDRLFAEYYILANCNGTEAARLAGHQGSDEALAVAATRHLKKPGVQALLDEKRSELAMSAAEVVQRLSDMARSSIDDCLDDEGCFDIAKARRLRKMHLLAEVTHETIPMKNGEAITRVKAKMHSAKAALDTLAKYHGLLTEVLAVRDLPKTERELLNLLRHELERVTGKPVDLTGLEGGGAVVH